MESNAPTLVLDALIKKTYIAPSTFVLKGKKEKRKKDLI